VVVENGDLDRKTTISKNVTETPERSIWLQEGESLTRRQLLYACMLNSATMQQKPGRKQAAAKRISLS
jgi:D-alanyl-D-alanine carboxypeptidase (penicillin-binding protein 5/6)